MGHYLTLSSEAVVVFESATPNWKDGKIRLSNVHVVCMPRSEQRKFQKRLKRIPWFDLTIDSVEVELSLMRLMEGKGIVKSADVVGVRGIIDNRRSGWNKSAAWDAETVRKSHIPGDFEMDRLVLEDMSVVVYMPKGFRPFPFSIIQAQFSRLRRQW